MKTLAKTKDMDRRTWLELRRKGIGGSDVSIIAGINRFRSVYQLWLEKTGQAQLEETDSEYAHFGTILEPLVKKEFMARTGKKIRAKNVILQSEEHPFMLCDLKPRQHPPTSRRYGKTASRWSTYYRCSTIWQ